MDSPFDAASEAASASSTLSSSSPSTVVMQTSLIPFAANYPSFSGNGGASRILNPTISDMELVWNVIKIGAYFGTLLLCVAPTLSEACAYPSSQEALEEELSDLLLLDENEEELLSLSLLQNHHHHRHHRHHQHHRDDDAREETAETVSDAKNSNLGKNSNKTNSQRKAPSRWSSFKSKMSKTVRTVKTTTIHSLRVALLTLFVSCCTYTTWNFIIAFLQEDRARYVDVSQWIARSDWMTASYNQVSLRPEQWFWSSQLLYFVVPMTLYVLIEYARSVTFHRRQVAVGGPSSSSSPAKNSSNSNINGNVNVSNGNQASINAVTEVIAEGAFSPLANLWLGCGVAISVSLPLALSSIMVSSWHSFGSGGQATLSTHAQSESSMNLRQRIRALRHAVPLNVWLILLPLAIAFTCVVMIPTADSEVFGLVLGALHACVLLPTVVAQFFPRFVASPAQTILVAAPRSKADRDAVQREWMQRTAQTLWIPVSFACFAAAILALHLVNFIHVAGSASANRLFATIFRGFCYNNCQCSISLDVVQCSIVVMAFIWFLPSLTWHERLFLCCSTPLLSLGFTFCCAIALEEMRVLNLRLTSDADVFDQVFPEFLFTKTHSHSTTTTTTTTIVASKSTLSSKITLSPLTPEVSGSFPHTTTTTTTNNNKRSVVTPQSTASSTAKKKDFGSSFNNSLNYSFRLGESKKQEQKQQQQQQQQQQQNKNGNKKNPQHTLSFQRTYLDDEDQTDQELFNNERARDALSPKSANEKVRVRRLQQQPIKPSSPSSNSAAASANAPNQRHHQLRQTVIVEEERRKQITVVDGNEEEDDEEEGSEQRNTIRHQQHDLFEEGEDEEDSNEYEETEEGAGDDYNDDDSSNAPHHGDDDDSRSSGISGVFSEQQHDNEENEADEENGEEQDEDEN